MPPVFPTPGTADSPPRYVAELQTAIAFTRSLSCTSRARFRPTAPMASAAFRGIVTEWARLNIAPRPEHRIAGRCLEITYALMDFLGGGGVSSIYTLGWMSFADEPVYHFTSADVQRWLSCESLDRDKLDMHAWLTLPSGEIIDPSWLSTVGVVRSRRELIGAVIIAEPAHPASHRYHPVLVDTAILARLGLVGSRKHKSFCRQQPPRADSPVVTATLVAHR